MIIQYNIDDAAISGFRLSPESRFLRVRHLIYEQKHLMAGSFSAHIFGREYNRAKSGQI
jgi:hypothetical protein